LGAALFITAYIYKPEILLIIFFTLTISGNNFDIPGLNINFKPILGLVVLIWSFTGKKKFRLPPYLSNITNQLVVVFYLYLLLLSWGTGSLDSEGISFLSLAVITAYLGYYSFSLKGNAYYIKISLVFAGLLCFGDLVYTYTVFGTFPVQRLFNFYIQNTIDSTQEVTNHNFFGFICGITFVMILTDYINKRLISKLLILLLPVMFLGVMMSTSRSTLLGLIVAIIILVFTSIKDSENSKRTYRILGLAFGIIAIALVVFISLESFFDLNSTFINEITYRLILEPVAVFRKNFGYSYNADNLDSLDWREQSAEIAYNVFVRLPFREQFFGIGYGAYLQRNLAGNGLNPHNGLLFILLETGIFGSLQYLRIVAAAIYRSLRARHLSSILLVFVFIIFYSLGQNEELIAATAMLFISGLIGEGIPARSIIEINREETAQPEAVQLAHSKR
jgi:O-antigen ligase